MYGFGMPMGGMGMGMPMGGMGMPMNNMNMMGNMGQMGGVEDEEWLKGFKMGMDEVNNPGGDGEDPDLNKPGPKLNVLFTTTIGTSRNIVLSHSTTIDQALKKYLKTVGKSNLINSDKISFLFNATKLNYGETKTVGEFFRNSPNPKVIVNDTNNLIGA